MLSFVLVYNRACALGWANVWFLTAVCALNSSSPKFLWDTVQYPLKVVQTLVDLLFHILLDIALHCRLSLKFCTLFLELFDLLG